MFFSTILSRAFKTVGKYNINPMKSYTKEEVIEHFVLFPASIGGIMGSCRGAYEGYEYTKDSHFAYNITTATVGLFYGYGFGAVFGAVWPISVPILVSRQIYGSSVPPVKV
jgi:hypothetical protein